ncbi:hypothetical protein RHSIM_Rhsim12G0159700 [Rhododendron simsii]|uniref:LOB domain-containing protein n=1 Tax=Rhododendron simsii TaxID=118357 RepID=A0A834G3W0_RHOSS|nr:hypothetical protein RHSIM_Rhsim12G0159700 [Rhododendron simsii]
MSLTGDTTIQQPPCAACKHQRRECANDCPHAPYFPPHQPKTFRNVRRLFHVVSVMKALQLGPTQRAEAMKSIIYQADIREKFPVHGCLGVIRRLEHQTDLAIEELRDVRSQLERYRMTSDAYDPKLYSGLGSSGNCSFPTTHDPPALDH